MAEARIDRRELIRHMLADFPEMRPLLKGYRTGVHQELSAFSRYTQAAIDRRQTELVSRCFGFVARCYPLAKSSVRAAIGSSYLEELDFSGTERRWAAAQMPDELRLVWVEVNVFLEDRLGRSRADVGFDRNKERERALRRSG